MLTGRLPFHAETLAGIMHHHFFTPLPDVTVARDDIPPALARIIARPLFFLCLKAAKQTSV